MRVLFFNHRPPTHLRKSGSSSRTLHFSTEYCLSSVRPESEDSKRLPWGSRSLFATSVSCVLCPRPFSSARCLAVRNVSHVLDGLLRKKLCGFISPHCHVQGSLFRGLLPRPQLMMFSHHLCLLVVRSSLANGSCPPSPLCRSAPSRLCSASES